MNAMMKPQVLLDHPNTRSVGPGVVPFWQVSLDVLDSCVKVVKRVPLRWGYSILLVEGPSKAQNWVGFCGKAVRCGGSHFLLESPEILHRSDRALKNATNSRIQQPMNRICF